MLIKRNILTIIILILCSFCAVSQKPIKGLLFSSNTERINNRTSLVLFDQKPLKMKNAFRVDFDLSIWDIKQFGYILRFINESRQEINFAFVNFYGEDKIYLDFHSPITHKSVQIPITKQDIEDKRWLPVSIIFDLVADNARVISKDTTYFCESIGLKNPSYIKLAFGLYGLNLDVPEMAVRNIHIEETGGKQYNIPLNEKKGETVRDDKGHVRGFVKNPGWLINKHFYWQEKAIFESSPLAGIGYDQKKNQVLVVDKDSVSAYSMRYDAKKAFALNNFPAGLTPGGTIYDDENDLLYIYNLQQEAQDEPSMLIINMKDHAVAYKYAQVGSQLYHHNVFLDGVENNLYIFGGYGNHLYSNKVFEYNPVADNWDSIEFSGNDIYPRYYSASGQGILPSQVLIMGGIGNESGKQEHGGKHLYDLYSLDMEARRITRMWEIKDIQPGFIPCGNLILDDSKTHFYTLCYSPHSVNATLQLYKFSIADGNYEIVSDTIGIDAEQIETSVFLFYNKLIQEFYTVIRENSEEKQAKVRIYALLAPPITYSELESEDHWSLYWWLFLLAAVPAFWFLRRMKKPVPEVPVMQKVNTGRKTYQKEPERVKKNSVYVFGDFMVFDKGGKDISYRFSSKLRSLFALIVINSVDGEGISTELLTSELWPDKDTNSAKNTRGVTINRLRGILADMSGITLVHQNSKWYFTFDPSFYCDYIIYKGIICDVKDQENNEDEDHIMSRLADILKRGALFPNLQENWIDSYKQEHENELERILWNYILSLYENKKYAKLIEYTGLYFIIDPLNENALRFCMHALHKTGKKDQAVLLYNKFFLNYVKVMGEEPNLPPL